MTLVDGSDERPGMSRDARNELRVKTVVEEDLKSWFIPESELSRYIMYILAYTYHVDV